jgi:hypothetical protein
MLVKLGKMQTQALTTNIFEDSRPTERDLNLTLKHLYLWLLAPA